MAFHLCQVNHLQFAKNRYPGKNQSYPRHLLIDKIPVSINHTPGILFALIDTDAGREERTKGF